MSSGAIAAVAVAVLVVLAVLFLVVTSSRRDRQLATGHLSKETRRRDRSREAVADLAGGAPRTGREVERAAVLERRGGEALPVEAKAAPPAPYVVDEETIEVTRRQFLNRSIVNMFGLGIAGFGAASIAFLWPSLSGGFGSKIRTRRVDEIAAEVRDSKAPVYVPEGRFYLVPYPAEAVAKARDIYDGAVLTGMEAGVTALYQKCVHLGCRVPWCSSAQWFECPCHGSRYNRVGERKAGPAPRGLDRFGVEVSGGVVVVDTKTVIQGPPSGTNTTGQEAEGPHCA